jgi:proline iminopeptidase
MEPVFAPEVSLMDIKDRTGLLETEFLTTREGRGDDRGRGVHALEWLWADWRVGFALCVVIATVFALVSAWWTPRGPFTSAEALISMAAALLVGVGAGLVTGSRWSMLATPVVFGIVFELARISTVGPTVDAINLGSFLGIVAFVLGRLAHGLLVLAPMILGASYGVWLADRLRKQEAPHVGAFAWTITGLASLALVSVAFFIANPAATAPILGADGAPLPGSVAELATVEIGGHEQVLMIRGRSVDNPVLLYLAGGPGGTDLGAMRRDVGLEADFVVATWEQRGAGKSYAALDPTETFTVDQFVTDTIEVTNYLRDRFDEDRIFLVGQSWGSTLGVLTAQQGPDLYHAFVGVGQMVSQRATDIMFWEDALAWAERTGNDGLVHTLEDHGPPPYENINRYDPVVSSEHQWNAYPGLEMSHEMPTILFVPEYNWMDRINVFKGLLDTNATLYPQLQDVDFREDVPRLEVPYYMVLGEHEARGRAVLANEWFDAVDAPVKERFIFEGSGHRPNFDRPADFVEVMTRVLADTGARN